MLTKTYLQSDATLQMLFIYFNQKQCVIWQEALPYKGTMSPSPSVGMIYIPLGDR